MDNPLTSTCTSRAPQLLLMIVQPDPTKAFIISEPLKLSTDVFWTTQKLLWLEKREIFGRGKETEEADGRGCTYVCTCVDRDIKIRAGVSDYQNMMLDAHMLHIQELSSSSPTITILEL